MVKSPPANARDIRDAGSIPGLGRSPGGGHGNPLQYSCLENPRDRGSWWATVHRVAKSWTQLKQLGISGEKTPKCYHQSVGSVAQSCWTLCDPMDCSMPGFPVHHQLRSLLKLMCIKSVISSNHLILCHPLLLLPSILPGIRVFSNESPLRIRWSKY